MAYQTTQLLLLHDNLFVYGFIFFATLGSYNSYWILSKISFTKKDSVAGLLKKETSVFFILILSATGGVYFFCTSGLSGSFIITSVLLIVIYSLPILPIKILQITRKAGCLKTILLSFTWAYVTAFMPIKKTYMLLNVADLFIISYRFLFMLMLCIIFDNRDKAIDKIRGLRSLATDVKPEQLKILVYIIFGILFISPFFYNDYYMAWHQLVALQISTLALSVVYFYATKKQGYFFYYFIVDGLMLFSALATYIAGI